MPRAKGRSPHPGVLLLAPVEGQCTYWRGRYIDPDTGKQRKEKINPVSHPDARTRLDWAKKKSKAIARRAEQLDRGAVRKTGTELEAVIATYYAAHTKLRPATITAYKAATNKLIAWCGQARIDTADNLNRAALKNFRASIANEPKRTSAKGKKRGKRTATETPRSPLSVNRELRAVRTVLGDLVDADQFARLTHDDLRRALKREKVDHERLSYMKPAELRALLGAALRHDATTHTITRKEHDGLRPVGTTPKFEAVAPFIAITLITGMRLNEALGLKWADVDLHARDLSGAEVGEIHLPAKTNKTHHARTIDLAVSPALRRLLAAMHLRDGGAGPVFRRRAVDEDGKPIALKRGHVDAAAKRLRGSVATKGRGKNATELFGFGAPKSFTWQALRRTCGTFLTNAPGIFGAASAYRSARQLGHSVTIAEKHYASLARGIPYEARDLETAMQITAELEALIATIEGKGEKGASNVIALVGR